MFAFVAVDCKRGERASYSRAAPTVKLCGQEDLSIHGTSALGSSIKSIGCHAVLRQGMPVFVGKSCRLPVAFF